MLENPTLMLEIPTLMLEIPTLMLEFKKNYYFSMAPGGFRNIVVFQQNN